MSSRRPRARLLTSVVLAGTPALFVAGTLGLASSASPAFAEPSPKGAPRAVLSRPRVYVYGAAWCAGCVNAKRYFSRRTDVDWTYVDIEAGPAQRAAYQRALDAAHRQGLHIGGVPIISIDVPASAGMPARPTRYLEGFYLDEVERVIGRSSAAEPRPGEPTPPRTPGPRPPA
jgi:glutaredoxin